MFESSYLDSEAIRSMCTDSITALTEDIADNDSITTELHNFDAENKLKGQAFDAFKNQLLDYDFVIQMCKDADNADIADFYKLYSLADETLDGSLIFDYYNTAKQNRDDYRQKASDERVLARNFNTVVWLVNPITGMLYSTVIDNPHEKNAKFYDSIADIYEDTMSKWQEKMDKFDSIVSASSGFFSDGFNYRNTAKSLLEAMERQSITGSYGSAISFDEILNGGDIDIISLYISNPAFLAGVIDNNPELAEYFENLKKIEEYRKQFKYVPSTEVPKIQAEIDKLMAQNEELENSIFDGFSNKEQIIAAIEYVKKSGLESEEMKELIVYWAVAGNMSGFENNIFPEDIKEKLNRDIALVQWKGKANWDTAKAHFDENVADYLIIMNLLNKSNTGILSEDELNIYFEFCILTAGTDVSVNDTQKAIKDALGSINYDDLKLNLRDELASKIWTVLAEDAEFYGWDIPWLQELSEFGKEDMKQRWDEYLNQLLISAHQLPGKDANAVYNILALWSTQPDYRMDANMIQEHYELNIKAWEEYKKLYSGNQGLVNVHGDKKEYIEQQNWFSYNSDTNSWINNKLYYGRYVSGVSEQFMRYSNGVNKYDDNGLYGSGNTCEIIATYNVLTFLGEDVYFPDLIKDYEENSPILGGNFGSAPDQVEEYMEAYGYETTSYSVDEMEYIPGEKDDYTKMLEECDAIIISEWNGDDPYDGMHTMAITIEKNVVNGEVEYTIVRHNDGSDISSGEYGYTTKTDKDGLFELINGYSETNDPSNPQTPLKVTGIKAN